MEFNKEEFLECDYNGYNKDILNKIEQYKDIPDVVKYLVYYRDFVFEHEMKLKKFHKDMLETNGEYEKQVANKLRKFADKIEESGSHFMIFCDVPDEFPLFKDKDHYFATVNITMVKGPLGG